MKNFGKHLLNNAYIYLLGMATLYLIFYSIYFLNLNIYQSLYRYDKLFSYLANVSILFFTTGIFTVALKYFQFLKIFQDEFNKAIASSEFDHKLTQQLKQVTFSKKFLIGQSNLDVLFEKVALCMYQQNFPEIYKKIRKRLKNNFFDKSTIEYYYKNFQIHYDITLDDVKYVTINEYVSYTIIRPNTDKFTWDFGYRYQCTTDERVGIEVGGKIINCGRILTNEDIQTEEVDGWVRKKVEIELEGHTEYHIERHVKSIVNIELDREHSFSSQRIIDDLTINVKHDLNLEVIFATVNNQRFYPNGAYPNEKHAYINRDIFLPGEKFKLFLIRPQ